MYIDSEVNNVKVKSVEILNFGMTKVN